ncbi:MULTISPECIES: globin-coupled sensor protein [Anoxybacillaceae]|uniref:Globin-coupled sensor protein n=1 Tax=Anoxybacteroides rupiense TaxID=311460 RepID=A0ABD5IUZ9_9BACL|nr:MULTISPECIES: globin-coupled sensor protein [Anoxybacillus]MBS2772948.1 globin-coupled sensor protein [Anoxybacillus rupiensis]MED5051624.1 globin-coupled sensor protein [Anoxybacillus rupiensis]OQM45768.1 chemotaxis protein [Anoxybacillus sp. UARK-01]
MSFSIFMRKKAQPASTSHINPNVPTRLVRLQNPSINKQIEMVELTERDLAILQALKPFIEEKIDTIVTRFYDVLQTEPSLLAIIQQHSSVEQLKQTLKVHVIEMFSGRIDDEFIAKRRRIAIAHLRIQLLPKWYMCAFQQLLLALLDVIFPHISEPHALMEATKSMTKVLSLEQQIVLEEYEKANERNRMQMEQIKNEMKEQLKAMVQELSTVSSEVSSSANGLTTQAKDILHFAKEAVQIADTSEQQSVKGQEKLQRQQSTIRNFQQMMKKIQTEVHSLQQSAAKIENINSLVTAIADQTNMLSLNASIEAARAGEHGKGFAVVANEVRNLASQTKQSVSSVADILNELNSKVHTISQSLDAMASLIAEGTDDMEKINQFFNEFGLSLKQIREQNQRIDHEMKQYVHVVSEMSQAIADVAASAEQVEKVAYDL